MFISVTGGAGFSGSHLVERLLRDGHRLRVLDNLSAGKRSNVPTHDRLKFTEGDVRDMDKVERCLAGVDAVFHLAVQASVDDPVGAHATNFGGTLSLLEAARRNRVTRFVFASCAAVYVDAGGLPAFEESQARPLSPYAADKLAGKH